MKIFTNKCDICDEPATNQSINVQVIFNYDQEDGKSKVKPYFDLYSLDFCKEHYDYLMEGHYVFGYGAMGYNKYSFKS